MSVQLFTGDSAEVLATFAPESIDLTVTSPPYDNLRTYKGYTFDFETIARELHRVTKPGGVVVWIVADATVNGSETGTSFRQALYFMGCGFNLHDTMLYRKTNFIPLTHRRYEQEWEYMFVFAKGSLKTFNPIFTDCVGSGKEIKLDRKGYGFKEGSFRRRSDVMTVAEKKQHGNIFEYACGASGVNHPAPFPEELGRDQILSWSNPGDTVLDCFLGSGTTGKMAVKYDRDFIGIEIAPEYMAIAEKRIKAVQDQPKLFEVNA